MKNDLINLIKNLYEKEIFRHEIEIAKDTLVGFFNVLKQIDKSNHSCEMTSIKELNEDILDEVKRND